MLFTQGLERVVEVPGAFSKVTNLKCMLMMMMMTMKIKLMMTYMLDMMT